MAHHTETRRAFEPGERLPNGTTVVEASPYVDLFRSGTIRAAAVLAFRVDGGAEPYCVWDVTSDDARPEPVAANGGYHVTLGEAVPDYEGRCSRLGCGALDDSRGGE